MQSSRNRHFGGVFKNKRAPLSPASEGLNNSTQTRIVRPECFEQDGGRAPRVERRPASATFTRDSVHRCCFRLVREHLLEPVSIAPWLCAYFGSSVHLFRITPGPSSGGCGSASFSSEASSACSYSSFQSSCNKTTRGLCSSAFSSSVASSFRQSGRESLSQGRWTTQV